MNRMVTFLLATVVAGVCVSSANAQGINLWDQGYPQSQAKGSITVRGTIIPDCGWTAGSGNVQVWLVGSGEVESYPMDVDPNTGVWQLEIKGLASGQSYNVVVQVSVMEKVQATVIATDPAQAKVQ